MTTRKTTRSNSAQVGGRAVQTRHWAAQRPPGSARHDAVSWAAHADLVSLTANMFCPLSPRDARPSWTQLTAAEWEPLLVAADLPEADAADEPPMAVLLADVFQQALATTPDDWSDEYCRLFDSSIACPINQAAYVRRDKGAILGDLAGFYLAFGWRPASHTGERHDHLLCQLEFVAILLAMGARAESGQQRQVIEDGLSKFAHNHMQDWLTSFCWHLCETTRLSVFAAAGAWLARLWNALSLAHRWPVEVPSILELPDDVENPYECAAQGLVQLGEH